MEGKVELEERISITNLIWTPVLLSVWRSIGDSVAWRAIQEPVKHIVWDSVVASIKRKILDGG